VAPADVIDQAAEEVGEAYSEPMSLEAFLEDEVDDHPYGVAQAPLYLLSAIEHYGTETVIEQGEEKERYRFFDDPANDGEHAVLGNTDVLNGIVDDLKNIAADRGKGEKMLWVAGPTATGKSELKRCMINMLEAYSRDHEPRYTIEWNTRGDGTRTDIGFQQPDGAGNGDADGAMDAEGWYESPVQTNPLLVLPEGTREEALDQLNELLDGRIDIDVRGDLAPFSQEAYSELLDRYRRESGVDDDDVFRESRREEGSVSCTRIPAAARRTSWSGAGYLS